MTHGLSIVDYAIVSERLLDHILYFGVDNIDPTISDCYCLLHWEMSANFTDETRNKLSTCVTKIAEPHFIWSEDSAFYFQQALTIPDIWISLSELANFYTENFSFSLDITTDRHQNILLICIRTGNFYVNFNSS
jgi:hypothetical protein